MVCKIRGQDVINGSVVDLEIPALMSQRRRITPSAQSVVNNIVTLVLAFGPPTRQTPTETDTTLLRHACDIQRRCLQSDRLEFRCDYFVYNLAAWRLGSKILLTVLLAWAPMLAVPE